MNTKALYRKGVALYHLKDPEGALQSLEKAHKQPDGEKGTNTYFIIFIFRNEIKRLYI